MQKSSDSRELICCYTWVLKIANEEVSEPNLFVLIGRFQPAARRLPRSQLAGCCLVGRAGGRASGRDADGDDDDYGALRSGSSERVSLRCRNYDNSMDGCGGDCAVVGNNGAVLLVESTHSDSCARFGAKKN